MVGPLRAQAVGLRERAVEVAEVEVAGERRELVHDHVGAHGADGGHDLAAVERIGAHGRRAERAHRLLTAGAPGERRHVMARRPERGHELPADGAGGAGHEDVHALETNGAPPL